MLSITAQSDADYYLRGCTGTREHTEPAGPAEYELQAVEHGEPPGEWLHRGENVLGLAGEVAPADLRALVNDLRDPNTGAALGSRPRQILTAAERVAKVERDNPDATPEQLAELRLAAQRDGRQSVHAWDLTFSLPKSWSVLHAALEREGRHDDAEQVWAAARAGIGAALDQAVDEHGWTRSGVGGPKVAGRVTAHYLRAPDWTAAMFRHHTSRSRDPQLHAHVMLLNRVLCADGKWRALYSPSLLKNKHQLDATFLRVAEAELTQRLGMHVAARPDGKAREIVGVSPEVRDLFSARSRALTEGAQQLVDTYTARWGRAPSALVQWQINQQATLASRAPKPEHTPTREQDLDQWEQKLAGQFRAGFASVLAGVEAAAWDTPDPEPIDPTLVIEQALTDLQERKGTWTRSHLYHAIALRLPDMLAIEPARIPEVLTDLTDAALAGRGVVDLVPAPAVTSPPSLLDLRTGRSVFEAPEGGRYTTAVHLDRETSLVARLEQRGAPATSRAAALDAVSGLDLSGEQQQVAAGILASDRRLHLVNAAAGTGKSRLMAALDQAAERLGGHGLTGLATAKNAADVLAREGVDRAHSIAAFLDFHDRALLGNVSDVERATFAVPRGATVVFDEASMISTGDMTRTLDVLDRVGAGRVIVVGDAEQVDAVDAGGAFAMLVDHAQDRGDDEPQVHELHTVRRFERQWERDASAAIRTGDSTALTQYDARARIHGGTGEAMRDAAVAGFVTDHLSGRDTVLVAATGDQAADASSRIRARLVDAGHVDRDGVALHDKTTAGVGDLVQTRRNDRRLDGGPVVNREVWQVVGMTSDDVLEVRRVEGRDEDGVTTYGAARSLPADYVRKHVELAYAGTVEAVQGRTVDASHTLADAATDRAHLYPAATRGRIENHMYVALDPAQQQQIEAARERVDTLTARIGQQVGDRPAADTQLAEARERLEVASASAETALGRVAAIVERDGHNPAALTALAEERDRVTHLGHLGPQWQAIVTETRAATHRDLIRGVLGADADRVLADRQNQGLFTLLRSAETTGHDPRAVLERAYGRGNLEGARSPARVLYGRVDRELTDAPRGEARVPFGFERRVPNISGGDRENERLQYARQVGRVMEQRTYELGKQVADERPAWAAGLLGPAPEDPGERASWGALSATAAAYREMYGRDERDALGPAPTRAEPERAWLWNMAAASAGVSQEARDRASMAALSRGELANREQQWQREQAWMPRNVDDDLRVTHVAHGEARTQAMEARTRGEDTTDREAEALTLAERVEQLERVAEVRAQAYEATRDAREAAERAREEVARRDDVDRAERDEPTVDDGEVETPEVVQPPRAADQEREPAVEDVEPERPEAVHQPEPEPMVGREPEPASEPERNQMADDLEAARQATAVLAEREESQPEPQPLRDEPAHEPELADD